MSSDNPFAEPDDADRTVIRPAPGGRRPPASPSASPARPQAAAAVEGPADMVRVGATPLAVAAAPLLQLLGRLRNTLSPPEPGDLRERAVGEMRRFEQAARDGGVPMEHLRPAHYALCASLDDVVQATPWGSEGAWAARSLVSTFHQEVRSGERFFDLLDQAKREPGKSLPVIELMYQCLSLGFQGRTRLSPRGPAELDRLREEVYGVIVRQRAAVEPELSPRWRGVEAPYRPSRARLPVWVAGAAALAVLCGLFMWFSFGLAGASDAVFARMVAAPPASMPSLDRPTIQPVAVARPPEPEAVDALCGLLRPEIARGAIEVNCNAATPVVSIRNRGLFASGRAVVQEPFVDLLERIGEALKSEPGKVSVNGYTDNQPIRTVQFPSNQELSAARAAAAAAIIGRKIGDRGRIVTEGRGASDPIGDNTTAAGQEQNRRIEVVLRRE